MNTPHQPGGAGPRGRRSGDTGRTGVGGYVGHAACSAAGLVVAGAVVRLFYPVLVSATQQFQLLSSTALVFALVWVWLLVWFGMEVTREWRADRFPFVR